MMPRSSLLTTSAIISFAAWSGAALLVALVVAPAAFAVLPSRAAAGALVGRVLPVLFWSGIGVGLLGAWASRTADAGIVATAASAIVSVASATTLFVFSPRIASIRTAVGGAIDTLDPTDPRRVAFGRLHGLSVVGMGIALAGALLALLLLARLVSSAPRAGLVTPYEKTLQWTS